MNLKNDRIASTIKDQVYEVIKKNILDGSITAGQRIQELQIAKDLQVSRSPVRSAIEKLIGEGLLECIPNKCVCVRQMSETEIIEAYEFRLIIEKFASSKAAENCSEEMVRRLDEMKDRFLRFSGLEHLNDYMRTDAEFHELLVECAGNSIISEALAKVSMLIAPFRTLALATPQRFFDSVSEHIRIIDALKAHDGEEAAAACEEHLSLAKEEVLKHLPSETAL